jgi:hypothetical protein
MHQQRRQLFLLLGAQVIPAELRDYLAHGTAAGRRVQENCLQYAFVMCDMESINEMLVI